MRLLRTVSACRHSGTSVNKLPWAAATYRGRACKLNFRRYADSGSIGNVWLSNGGVSAAAAAHPWYGQESGRSVPEQQQQQQQPQQELAQPLTGARGFQQVHAQQSGKEQLEQQQQQQQQSESKWQKVQGMLQQYGPGAFFSYITCSNVLSVTMLASAWLLFTRTTGYTPLQAGQWPQFLVFYGGAYAMAHAARPVKLAVGLACAPAGTAAVDAAAWALRSSKVAALVVLLVVEAAVLLCCLGAVLVYANRLALTVGC